MCYLYLCSPANGTNKLLAWLRCSSPTVDSVGDLAAAIAPPEGEDPPLWVNLVGELVAVIASPEGEDPPHGVELVREST